MTDLDPGPELDALVAEKLAHLFVPWPWQFTDEDGVTHDRIPQFSTDWRAAGEVLERLIRPWLHGEEDGTWIMRHATEGKLVVATGKTGPHAIALAALAAVETPVGG